MKRRELERLLDRLVVNVPRGIRQAGLKPNACILAGRMATEGLRAKGLRARALSVELAILNAEYWRRYQLGQEPTAETEQEWMESGARILAISDRGDEEGWAGHLVVIVEERYVLDLTAGQFDRPEKGIPAKPFWLECRELARGLGVVLEGDAGARWLYEPRPGDRSFVSAPAWSAYRVRVAGGQVISERTGPNPDAPVAPEISLPIEG